MIRKATIKDIKAIAAIYEDIHTEEEKGTLCIGWQRGVYPTEQTAADSVAKGDMFVCERDGLVIGAAKINKDQVDVYAYGDWEFPADDEKVMVLHTLVVSPAVQTSGIGKEFATGHEYAGIRFEHGRFFAVQAGRQIELSAHHAQVGICLEHMRICAERVAAERIDPEVIISIGDGLDNATFNEHISVAIDGFSARAYASTKNTSGHDMHVGIGLDTSRRRSIEQFFSRNIERFVAGSIERLTFVNGVPCGVQAKFAARLQKVQIGLDAFSGIGLSFGVDVATGNVYAHIVVGIAFYVNGILGRLVHHQSNTGTQV